jgi:hypothetical protein
VLSVFSVEKNAFERVGGEMKVEVGGSVVDLPLKGMVAAK